MFASVPRVSVREFRAGGERAEAEVATLQSAFERQGMALIVDHGVPREVIDGLVQATQGFFALPRAEKERFAAPSKFGTRGWGGITYPRGKVYRVQQEAGGEILNEWLQFRAASVPYDAQDAYYTSAEGREFFTPESAYPEQQSWPDVPALQGSCEAYYAEIEELARAVAEMFARALGAPGCFLSQRGPLWPVTVAHYPPQSAPPPAGTMRIQPHWDRNFFSLITTNDVAAQSNGGGLQIYVDPATGDAKDGDGGEWRNVPIEPDCFVLNCGEVMARWTNGRFKHVVHRVPNPPPGGTGRVAVMAYVQPDYDTRIDPQAFSADAPRYEPSWVGELHNWNSKLPIYDAAAQDRMRRAQGLYTEVGLQAEVAVPSDVGMVA